ncbi:hypothetical protein QJS04_geneDACA001508 [Acorus gramineus]|uniref:Uncharacterized protein n=1 Tax=Acorus gramineus TaxID=55184 RepID=A0AAV9BK92_ACOGR|nr:hypothetical protein QJS04_geneDACA001508 [Acorus gramineus]
MDSRKDGPRTVAEGRWKQVMLRSKMDQVDGIPRLSLEFSEPPPDGKGGVGVPPNIHSFLVFHIFPKHDTKNSLPQISSPEAVPMINAKHFIPTVALP